MTRRTAKRVSATSGVVDEVEVTARLLLLVLAELLLALLLPLQLSASDC